MGGERISPVDVIKKKRFLICSEVIESITHANSRCLGRGLGWLRCGLRLFDGGLGGFGLAWQVNVIKRLLNFFFNYYDTITKTYSGC